MKSKILLSALGMLAVAAANASAPGGSNGPIYPISMLYTDNLQSTLPSGTEVNLVFQQPLNSRSAKAGETVRFMVKDDVADTNGNLVIRRGTPVTGVIERVDKNDHFGKNARIRLTLNPVNGITLAPRDKGNPVGGTRTDEAAAASGGAALVFGPLGLAAGYFVVGHSVHVHRGDTLRTEVVPPPQ